MTIRVPGLSVDNVMPWVVDVDVFPTAISHVNWDTLSVDTAGVYNFRKDSTDAQNNEINFDVVLAAGTWTMEMIHTRSTNRPIYTFSLGGTALTSLGAAATTIDGYNGSADRNRRDSITGVAIPTSGKYRLRLLLATKNASSTGYVGSIQHIQFRRTA